MQQRSTKQHMCKLIPPLPCSLTVILSLALLTGSKLLRSQSRSLLLQKPRHRPRSHGTPIFWENPSAALHLQASGGTIFQYMVAVLLTNESHFVTDIGNEHLLLSALLHQSCDPICYQNCFIFKHLTSLSFSSFIPFIVSLSGEDGERCSCYLTEDNHNFCG